MAHVFISYAHTDTEYARKLADHLISNGFDVWIDDRIDFGSRWVRSIFEALEACAAFIVIMTPKAYESEFVEKEYLHAGNLDKPTFPLLLEGRAFPYFVGIQYYDVQDRRLPGQEFFEDLARFVPRSSEGHDVATTATQEIKQAPRQDATGVYLTIPKESAAPPPSVAAAPTPEVAKTPESLPVAVTPAPEAVKIPEPSPAAVVPAPDTLPKTQRPGERSRSSLFLAGGAVVLAVFVIFALLLSQPDGTTPEATETAPATENIAAVPTLTGSLATPVGIGRGEIAFVSDLSGNNDIYLMSASGGEPQNLTNDAAYDSDPAWSPDGSQIVFTSDRDFGGVSLYIMDVDGSNLHPLLDGASGWDPAWSPDGTLILYTAYSIDGDGFEEIFIVGAEGGESLPLTSNNVFDGYAAWSPDGSKIVYASNPNGNMDIYVMDADGNNATALTDDPAPDILPVWSPDGSQIAFQSERIGYPQICLMNSDGTDQHCTPTEGQDGYDPAWSPDGTMLVYGTYRDNVGGRELYLMDNGGNILRRLTDNVAEDAYPAWRP